MNNTELLACFEAEERAVQAALQQHGVTRPPRNRVHIEDFPPIVRDALALADDALCDAIRMHLEAGEDPDAALHKSDRTAVSICFSQGKFEAMRLLIRAGAKIDWSEDQITIALGETPASLKICPSAAFRFACRVGNLNAAIAFVSVSEAGREKAQEAVIAAVHARASNVVAWLLEQGFDPNAITHYGCSALEIAAWDDDTATAEVLLAAGADPLGPHDKESTAAERASSHEMRSLFVRYGVHPARFKYETNPEGVPLSFLPAVALDQEDFDSHRSARAGRANPERFLPPFWYEQLRTGHYTAPKEIARDEDRSKPIWTFSRMGRSVTPLPDGRLVLIGGEYEDDYDPDFCIYADVTVLDGKGGVDHFIYPEDVFPPTDFHTATLVGDHILLIGAFGYPERRQKDLTPVLRLDLANFSIQSVETTGDGPGWVYKHRATLDGHVIIVTGGKTELGFHDNEETYLLDLETMIWRRAD
ncbi:ankyrin repeat domain-containing protein [Roseibium aggregatum]|uniref:Ankyrin repeat protein n=1 Tax=Roseibium aggregatum TaxID=187304 RepID=A0A926NYB4_9HYPH|nr:ankyrin repeat domain-containing protein [Roseibium aggregatum]MBD1545958.1 hypothetical protein [Roseibium aggregatum]